MSKRNFRTRRTSDTSEDEDDDTVMSNKDDSEASESTTKISAKEKIDELKFIQKQRERKNGIDVYSLAIGEQKIKSTKADSIEVIKFREFLSMLNVKLV